MDCPKILLVEDDFLIRLTLVEALVDEGFDVLEAGSAAEALAHLGSPGISLMMTDIQLPGGINGEQLALQVRAAQPDLPIIFMSGQPSSVGVAGPRDLIISKPYLPSEICAAARRLTASDKGN